MKKSSKASKAVMSGGMFMNSSSSNASDSEEEKCHLPTADLILSENEKDVEEQVVVIRRNTSRLRRQQATTSLQSPLSVRNLSSLESIDNIHDGNLSHRTASKKNGSLLNQSDRDFHRTSFNESERTDSGIGRDSGSSWRFSTYSDSFHPSQQHHQLDKQQDLDSNNDGDEDDDEQLDSDANETRLFAQINNDTQLPEDSLENLKLQKAGWLHVKHWLTVQRQGKLELASKRQWKRLWICLQGSNLSLYTDQLDNNPKVTISIIESLCHPFPEHPNRQHVFSLTTRTGDTYCFQAADQFELEQWIRHIYHCCCSRTDENALKAKINALEDSIERENQMQQLGEVQLKSSTDPKVRLLISKQIDLWERNLEAFHADLFRHKCYLCALTNERLFPNPKDLLSQVCPSTRAALNKLTTLTPCSLYACVTARRRLNRQKSKPRLINTSVDGEQRRRQTKCYFTMPTSPIDSLQTSTVTDQSVLQMVTCDANPQMRTIVSVNETTTVGELLKRVTEKLGLQIDDHFLCFDSTSSNSFISTRAEKLCNLTYSAIEIRRKTMYQITLEHPLELSGIDIATELHGEYSLQVVVTDVKVNSESDRLGVRKDDEIVIVNNSIVQDLDLDTLDRYFNQTPIVLTLRCSRLTERNHDLNRTLDFSHAIIQNLICPPPPPRRIERLSRQELRELVVPKPDSNAAPELPPVVNKNSKENEPSSSALECLLKNVDELSRYCRPITTVLHSNTEQTPEPPRIKALSNAQRLRKVIFELIETERSYVQDMQRLLERYLEPLRDDSKLLPTDAIESLYVSVKSIHQLQLTFLARLESNLPTEVLAYNTTDEFREILISISETFLSYSQYFKLYSTFCAMHLRINRLLDQHQNNQHLKEFLSARNPRHQHSSSFESYLIKPVQRILKYPLLLQQMFVYSNNNISEKASPEPTLSVELIKLKQAIGMINHIAEYMNGMQQLYEDFGQSFEYITKTFSEEHNKSLQLNLPDLYVYGEVEWLNMHLFLGKNHPRLKAYCFVFRNGCLLLAREQSNKKKQDFLSISKGNKLLIDRFLRFLPIDEINVEILGKEESRENVYTWQLIQTDPKTRLKTYFRFANKDAQTLINTINNCISSSSAAAATGTAVEWRPTTLGRSRMTLRNSDPSYSVRKSGSTSPRRLSSSHSYHTMVPSHSKSLYQQKSDSSQRSPSPIWKRRTTPIRRQPLSINEQRQRLQNSTDC